MRYFGLLISITLALVVMGGCGGSSGGSAAPVLLSTPVVLAPVAPPGDPLPAHWGSATHAFNISVSATTARWSVPGYQWAVVEFEATSSATGASLVIEVHNGGSASFGGAYLLLPDGSTPPGDGYTTTYTPNTGDKIWWWFVYQNGAAALVDITGPSSPTPYRVLVPFPPYGSG
jgi:hypothetical protein